MFFLTILHSGQNGDPFWSKWRSQSWDSQLDLGNRGIALPRPLGDIWEEGCRSVAGGKSKPFYGMIGQSRNCWEVNFDSFDAMMMVAVATGEAVR